MLHVRSNVCIVKKMEFVPNVTLIKIEYYHKIVTVRLDSMMLVNKNAKSVLIIVLNVNQNNTAKYAKGI